MGSHVKVDEYWAASSSSKTVARMKISSQESRSGRDTQYRRHPSTYYFTGFLFRGGSSESLVSLDAILASQASGNRRGQCHGLGARVAVGGVLE